MADIRTVLIGQLLFHEDNPRLHQEFADQRGIIEALLEDRELGPKIVTLAEDIAKFGLSPADLLIVTAEGAPPDNFIVAEGNRRLAALRLLQKPALADEVLPSNQVARLRTAAKSVSTTITAAPVVVMSTLAEADHWIELRHGGESGGAGTVTWDGRATDRWRSRHETAGSFIGQLLDLLTRLGIMPDWYAADPGRFPTTTLDRILIGKERRERFGLRIDDNGFLILLNTPAAITKTFKPIVEDLASRRVTVTDLKRVDQRDRYVAKSVTLPTKATKLQAPLRADTVATVGATESPNRPKASTRTAKLRPTREQKTLIGKTAGLNVTKARINDIYDELQRLEVEDTPNSVGVMFRVFLELSIDEYIKWHKPPLMSTADMHDSKKGTLAKKIALVAKHMEDAGLMTRKELMPVRKLTDGSGLFDSRVTLMNGFVHNASVTPKPSELKTEWNDLTEFFRKLWP